jgi:UDP-3-O-[3-hydroxymyristoyl] glucosamine N-acyltransferase
MSMTDTMTLEMVARWTGGRVEGDASIALRRPAPLETATENELGLLADRKYLAAAAASQAGAFLVSQGLEGEFTDSRPRVVVPDARAALVPILERMDPTPRPEPGVHPTAVLETGVQLGEGVSVGPYAVLEAGCVIGDGSRVGAHCVVGARSVLGASCYLFPHVVLYPNTVLGSGVRVHSGARLGSDGFGFVVQDGGYRRVPQVGGCVLADNVEVGANTCLDRGWIGDTVVGRGSKLDNLVHLAHNVRVGEHVAMAAMTGVAGSTEIGAWAQFGGQAGAAGHIRIGDGARIAAQAGVIGDVADGAEVTGYPARELKQQLRVYAASAKVPDALKRLRVLEREVEALRARLEGGKG